MSSSSAFGIAAAVASVLLSIATMIRRPSLPGAVVDDAAPPRTAPRTALRVYSQNCWCHYLATPIGQWRGVHGAASPVMSGIGYSARIDQLAHHIIEQKFDVVLIQEVFVCRLGPVILDGNFKRLAAALRHVGLEYHTDPMETLPAVYGQNTGTVIFSRFPLLATESHVFHKTAEGFNNKGFVAGRVAVEVGDGRTRDVLLVSTHLDARSWLAKESQIGQVAEYVATQRNNARTASKDQTEVVAGDFNLCPQTTAEGGYDNGDNYTSLAGALRDAGGLVSAWELDHTAGAARADMPLAEYPVTEGDCTLDHIFLRGRDWDIVAPAKAVRFTDAAGNAISDHLGVTVTIKARQTSR
jgi:endonuclease/exonuclease/phosphatase family metal-dependent hydrolase